MRAGAVKQARPDLTGVLRRLARDRSGNTLALMGAALLPMLGIVGGAVDMSRAYLASSRLQQACDAGVLAARKRLGTVTDDSEQVSGEAAEIGQRFFNLNFRDGNYGTEERSFQMQLSDDNTVYGEASVSVPTAVMTIFGFEQIPVTVTCEATMSVQNVDVMMVLDVTGSMRHTNVGDSMSRLESLKQTIRNFHAQVDGAASGSSRIRFGFVPYSTHVNVGHLLKDEWVADEWEYETRVWKGAYDTPEADVWEDNVVELSGSSTGWTTVSSYAATVTASTTEDLADTYSCTGSQPAGTLTRSDTVTATRTVKHTTPKATETIQDISRLENGKEYRTQLSGSTCQVQERTTSNYRTTLQRHTYLPAAGSKIWYYTNWIMDTSNWRAERPGCMEERQTYMIEDYDNVDLDEALDLNIDLIPQASKPETQWGPHWPEIVWTRQLYPNGTGAMTEKHIRISDDYAQTGMWWMSQCPSAKARKLAPISQSELESYLSTLYLQGATYHDIGMLWGARLISPTGLFASENADSANGGPTARNLIFLTDGQTEPYDVASGAYGLEPLRKPKRTNKRWLPTSSMSLKQHVEERFKFICKEVKKRNITVWVIAFGTDANDAMTECAGEGRYFEAANADELDDAFRTIAGSLGDLRITG